MTPDIYTEKANGNQHSLCYLKITVRNVIGILNRIASLMRRKRYNMEEVSVSFDKYNIAHIMIAIDARFLDVTQVIRQLYKLHDVMEVCDVSEEQDKLFNTFYVRVKDKKKLGRFPVKPAKVVQENKKFNAIFIVSFEETPRLIKFLKANQYYYIHRLLSLISLSEKEAKRFVGLSGKYQQYKGEGAK